MYKNLDAKALGISGRQSDLIELAMTYGFQGLNIDAVDLQRRTARTDFEKASRFLLSSGMRVSGFDVPCDLDADDQDFERSLREVEAVVEVAGKAHARAGYLLIPPATNRAPFPQFFEFVKSRIERLAEIFTTHKVLLGLGFTTFVEDRQNQQYAFVQDVNSALALIQACQSDSVGFVVDTYHWTVGKGTWEQLTSLPAGKIAGLCLADTQMIPEIKESSESHKLIAGTVGTIDNSQFAKTLDAHDFDGPITSSPSSKNLGSIKRDTIVSKAQDVLDATLTAAGLTTQTRRPEWIAAQATNSPEISSLEDLG